MRDVKKHKNYLNKYKIARQERLTCENLLPNTEQVPCLVHKNSTS